MDTKLLGIHHVSYAIRNALDASFRQTADSDLVGALRRFRHFDGVPTADNQPEIVQLDDNSVQDTIFIASEEHPQHMGDTRPQLVTVAN